MDEVTLLGSQRNSAGRGRFNPWLLRHDWARVPILPGFRQQDNLNHIVRLLLCNVCWSGTYRQGVLCQ